RKGEVSQSELASLMVGRPLGDMFPPKSRAPEAEPILSVRNLSDGARVFGVSLDLRPGEILGLAGLIGSGRTEVAEMLVGLRNTNARELARTPEEAAKRGLAYVSEDRKDSGLILSMDVVENITLPNLKVYARPILLKGEEE